MKKRKKPVAQRGPEYPTGQIHWYPLRESEHIPPFKQGEEEQSLTSMNYRLFCHILFLFLEFRFF